MRHAVVVPVLNVLYYIDSICMFSISRTSLIRIERDQTPSEYMTFPD